MIRPIAFGDNSRRAVVGRAEKSYTFQYGHHVVQLFEQTSRSPLGALSPKISEMHESCLRLEFPVCLQTACMSPRTAAAIVRADRSSSQGSRSSPWPTRRRRSAPPRCWSFTMSTTLDMAAAEATESHADCAPSRASSCCFLSLSLFFFCVRCDATFLKGIVYQGTRYQVLV